VAQLEQALRAAARGLAATVQLIGDLGIPPPPVARAVQATADAVLSSLPPHPTDPAVLTVLATDDRAVPDFQRAVADSARPDAIRA
jgi:hypothetical protein